jgi:trk system potassium uptake protein
MRVLIAGAGRAGMSVASHLRAADHEVTIIDKDEHSSRRAFEDFGLVALTGDATDAALLREAEAGRADVVVAMLRRDADNLAVVLLAKQLGATRIMVRMRDPDYRPVYKAAGVSRILSEIDVFIGALATAIEHEGVRHSMILGGGGSVAFELSIPPTSKVVDRTVSNLATDPGFPPSCVFGALYHPNGEVLSPRGSSIVAGGMTVLLVSRREEMADVVRFFVSKRDSIIE